MADSQGVVGSVANPIPDFGGAAIAPGAALSGTVDPVLRPGSTVEFPPIPAAAAAALFPPVGFEERFANSLRDAASEVEASGKRFVFSFRTVLEHAFTAHGSKFANLSDFETNMRMHLDQILTRAKETGKFI